MERRSPRIRHRSKTPTTERRPRNGKSVRIRRPRVSRTPTPEDDRRPGEGETLADFYGEIANASVKETKKGNDTIYEFQRRVGTKGAFTPAQG